MGSEIPMQLQKRVCMCERDRECVCVREKVYICMCASIFKERIKKCMYETKCHFPM